MLRLLCFINFQAISPSLEGDVNVTLAPKRIGGVDTSTTSKMYTRSTKRKQARDEDDKDWEPKRKTRIQTPRAHKVRGLTDESSSVSTMVIILKIAP